MYADAAPLWDDISRQEALLEPDIAKLVSAWHTDADLGRPIEVVTDMSKSRKLGFTDYQASDDSFFDLFALLSAKRVIPSFPPVNEETAMTKVTYEIVRHDGGWAYRVDETFSESFPTHDAARDAAQRAAKEQIQPDRATTIEYEDKEGRWHTEKSTGHDQPKTRVKG